MNSTRGFLSRAVILICGFCTLCLSEWPAQAAQQWRMTTSWPGGPLLDDCAKAFARRVELLTEGRLKINVMTAGVLGEPLQVVDTVKSGVAQAGHTWPGYDWGRDKTSILFGGYAGGLDSLQLIHWLYERGGQELWRKWREEKFGVIALPVCVYPTEIFLHSKKPVRNLADLRGLRIRSTGMWQEVLKEMGAAPVTASGGEIYPMLERGVIDATEWGTPWMNVIAGFHKAAHYIITPGYHQPGTADELLINKDAWQQLAERDRELLAVAARLETVEFWLKNGSEDLRAMQEFTRQGNEIIRLDPEVGRRARELAGAWADREAQNSPWVKQVLESQRQFAREWRESGAYRELD